MVGRRAALALALGALAATRAAAGPAPDIAALALSWPPNFVLTGTKTEPTYIEHVRVMRAGDRFVLEGGAPAGMAPSRESLVIAADGSLRHVDCPAAMRCDDPTPPTGFLATAAIVAAARSGRLAGPVRPVAYGDFQLVCVPAEALGVADPILDPCVELRTGAVLAQRHRRSNAFDGPSLDPWSIELSADAAALPTQ
jgi:hypothetical protein